MYIIDKDATDVSIDVEILDTTSGTGDGLAALVFNSSGLQAYYHRPGAAPVEITLATMTVTGSHDDGGFVELDATNMKGNYRLDLPDAVCATGVPFATVILSGATDMADCRVLIMLRPPVDSAATIVAYGLDHLLSASVTGADITDNSIIARMASKGATADWDTFVNTTDSLEAIRDSQVIITPSITLGPAVSVNQPAQKVSSPVVLECFEGEAKSFVLTINDADGDAINLSAKTLKFVVEDNVNPPNSQFDVDTPTITISGTDSNVATIPVTASDTGTPSLDFHWRLWDTVADLVYAHGPFKIFPSTKNHA